MRYLIIVLSIVFSLLVGAGFLAAATAGSAYCPEKLNILLWVLWALYHAAFALVGAIIGIMASESGI